MKIGELAKLSGVAASRIRFYESAGLLQTATRQANGYRDYSPDDVLTLQIIISAQRAGFSLEEVRNLMPACLSNGQHDGLIEALQRKVAEIEAMQVRLAESKGNLLSLIEDIQNKPEGMDCSDNAKRLLSRHRK